MKKEFAFFRFFPIFFSKNLNFQIDITRKLSIFDKQCINEICCEYKFIQLLLLHYDDILKFFSSIMYFTERKNI